MKTLTAEQIEQVSGGSTISDAVFGGAKCVIGAGIAFGGLIATGPSMGLSGTLAWAGLGMAAAECGQVAYNWSAATYGSNAGGAGSGRFSTAPHMEVNLD